MITPKEQQLIQFAHIFNNPWAATLLLVLAIWVIVWKGIALWKAARNNSNIWFILLLALNTVGILEIIYIFFFSNKKEKA
jgi:heme A synthase